MYVCNECVLLLLLLSLWWKSNSHLAVLGRNLKTCSVTTTLHVFYKKVLVDGPKPKRSTSSSLAMALILRNSFWKHSNHGRTMTVCVPCRSAIKVCQFLVNYIILIIQRSWEDRENVRLLTNRSLFALDTITVWLCRTQIAYRPSLSPLMRLLRELNWRNKLKLL